MVINHKISIALTLSVLFTIALALPANAQAQPLLRSPSSTTGGWSTPDGAYADGGTSASITSAKPSASQTYSGYGFNLPLSLPITQVRIRYDARTAGNEQIRVNVSWDGGTTWSAQQVTNLTTTETTYWYDVTGATTWNPTKLNDTNLRVKVDAFTVGGAAVVYLDWIPVEASTADTTSPTVTLNSPANGSTVTSPITFNYTPSDDYGLNYCELWGNWSTTFTERNISTTADAAYSVYAIDIDSDGDIDALSASMIDDTIAWYKNNGSESFTKYVISSTADGANSVFAIDVDGDLDIDVLSASLNDDTIAWYENNGSESFTKYVISTTADGAQSVFAIDVDGDLDIDVLSASGVDDTIAWYENNGSESFTKHVISTSVAYPTSVYAIDVDGDLDIDVLSASLIDYTVAWYENNGAESFTKHAISTTDDANSVFAIDVDGDGDIDVLSASVIGDTIAWFENNGSESFTKRVISTTADYGTSVYAIDVDGDGDIDVLSASKNDNKIAWYENNGAESFTEHIISTTAGSAYSVFAIDVDGDGDIDVLSASVDDDKIAWYENIPVWGPIKTANNPTNGTTNSFSSVGVKAGTGEWNVKCYDFGGNSAFAPANWTFTISVAPTLSVSLTANPNSGTAPLNDVDLTATVTGTATGDIIYKFDCTNDGTWEHTSAATANTTYTATDLCDYASAGTYTAKVEATRQGLTATNTTTITVTAPTLFVALSANPNNGTNPLEDVDLTASVSGTATGNIVYKFDCTNNGIYEHTSTSTALTTYTATDLCDYPDPGTYTAKVEATRQGLIATNTTTINVSLRTLTVSLTANPDTGTNPLNDVDLTATVSGNATGNIIYKFDCTNDGIFEHTSALTPNTTYTAVDLCNYPDPGTYTAKVIAERQALTAENTTNIVVVLRTLSVTLSASPDNGVAPLNGVSLTATVGGNATGNIIYKFDCTNDGIFEHTSVATTNTTYTASGLCNYADPGTYTAKVEVSRQDLTATNTTTISVIPLSEALSVSLTADPSSGVAPLNNVDLSASVTGSATGDITYNFDCTNDGSFEQTITTSQTIYTAVDLCNYAEVGTYTAKVEVSRAGLTNSNTTTINVGAGTLTVTLTANPNSGTNPLQNVDLIASVGGTATGDIIYKFDCTNDGIFEHTSSPTTNTTYTATDLCNYADPGAYTARVEATRRGLTATNTTDITVILRTLTVSLTADPNLGDAPLSGVDLTATVSGNATGNIIYKFDCTNDGSFEHTSAATLLTTYTATDVCNYTDPGTYTAKVVAERESLTAENTTNIVVSVPTTLTVSLSADPDTGTNPLNDVDLIATIGGTATGNIIYRFDCTNDGVYEHTSTSTTQTTYTATDLCDYPDPGIYTARVEATRGGLTATDTATITVILRTLTVSLAANPNTGTNPLNNVDLTATVGGNATGNIIYKFDCTNDGVFEHTSSATTNTTYTASGLCNYSDPGIYTALVQVSRQGLIATNTTNINVIQRTLMVSLTANPNSGVAPLSGVDLSASVSGNATGDITYNFDCTNDGVFEHTSMPIPETIYTATDLCNYTDPGSYIARVRVERQGLTAENITTITIVSSDAALAVSLTANPNSGIAPLNGVSLEATVSGVATGDITYKFDCTNDGIFENTSSPTLTNPYSVNNLCNYPNPGNYTARVEVDRKFSAEEGAQTITKSATAGITVSAPPLVITTSDLLPSGTINQLYSTTIEATGGWGIKTFALLTGALPTGLVLDPTGVISGTPLQDGIFYFMISVTDTQPVITSQKFQIFISPPPPPPGVPQTNVVSTDNIDPSAGGGAKLINANNTEFAIVVESGAVSGITATYSIVIISLSNQSTNFAAVPNITGTLIGSLNYQAEVIDDATGQKIITFSQPITVKISYLDNELPSGADEAQLKIYFYNEATSQWEALPTTVDTGNNIATAAISHLTRFALVGAGAPIIPLPQIPAPAAPAPVPKVGAKRVDFNNDNRVNLVDFSILAYWYKRANPPSDLDINKDSKIDLVEFSTLIFYWTR